MTTKTLKRSAKKIVDKALESGWILESIETRANVDEIFLTLPPSDDPAWPELVEKTSTWRYSYRRLNDVVEVVLHTDAETGALFNATFVTADGSTAARTDKLGEALSTVAFRADRIAAHYREVEREAAAAVERDRRREIHDAFIAGLDDYRYRDLKRIAAHDPEPPDLSDVSIFTKANVESYMADRLAKRMAEIALETVGWPDDDDVPTSVTAAIATGVSTIMGHESGRLDSELVKASLRLFRLVP